MCIICVDLVKDKLTSLEARRNLDEMHTTLNKEHVHEVLQLIWKKEDEEYAKQFYSKDEDEFHGDTD